MNEEKIMNMTAGRVLDALVAEKVMGLCVVNTLQLYGDGCVVTDSCMDEWLRHKEYGKTSDPDVLPYYSTDISAAWEVMNRFETEITIRIIPNQEECSVMIHHSSGHPLLHWVAFGKDAPEAICKAALLATGR